MFDDPDIQAIKQTADLAKLIDEKIVGQRLLRILVLEDTASFQFEDGSVLHLRGRMEGLRVELPKSSGDAGGKTVQ